MVEVIKSNLQLFPLDSKTFLTRKQFEYTIANQTSPRQLYILITSLYPTYAQC